MAGTTLDELPSATSLSGQELLWVYQPTGNSQAPWVGLSCTSSQLATLPPVGGTTVSMRQLFAAMAADDVLVTAFEALSGDITNAYNIAWSHAYIMTIGDPFVTSFLMPAIGYNTAQMQALFAFALTFPV